MELLHVGNSVPSSLKPPGNSLFVWFVLWLYGDKASVNCGKTGSGDCPRSSGSGTPACIFGTLGLISKFVRGHAHILKHNIFVSPTKLVVKSGRSNSSPGLSFVLYL